jgi:hypothetical protein
VSASIRFLHPSEAAAIEPRGIVHRFAKAMSSAPIEVLVRNVRAELLVLAEGETVFPLTVTDARDENSYVCSPYTTYVSYAREELPKLANPALERALGAVIGATGAALERGRVDDVVFVNNWLLSTNLYPRWSAERIDEIVRRCTSRWPDHALAFRSLNADTNRVLLAALRDAGFFFLPSRQVYLFDGRSGAFAERHNTRIDLGLLSRDYEIVPHERIEPRDMPRFEALYRMLYLDKYSYLNPQYTAEFMRAAHETEWLRFSALRSANGSIDGVLGTFEIDGVITAPIVGYDTSAPRSKALYRRLMAIVLRETLERGLTLNLSSGAAEFKRLRGGTPAIEYTAVYDRHLSVGRRAVWRSLAALVDRIGVPLLRRYEL